VKIYVLLYININLQQLRDSRKYENSVIVVLILLLVVKQKKLQRVKCISRTVAVEGMNETSLSSPAHVINSGTIQDRSEVR
jgi:hypothetical protein